MLQRSAKGFGRKWRGGTVKQIMSSCHSHQNSFLWVSAVCLRASITSGLPASIRASSHEVHDTLSSSTWMMSFRFGTRRWKTLTNCWERLSSGAYASKNDADYGSPRTVLSNWTLRVTIGTDGGLKPRSMCMCPRQVKRHGGLRKMKRRSPICSMALMVAMESLVPMQRRQVRWKKSMRR